MPIRRIGGYASACGRCAHEHHLSTNLHRPIDLGNAARPAYNVRRPRGNATHPAYNVPRPRGNATRPAYNVGRPCGNACQRRNQVAFSPRRGEKVPQADEGSPSWQNADWSSPHLWLKRHHAIRTADAGAVYLSMILSSLIL
jgi:hypothetical protein